MYEPDEKKSKIEDIKANLYSRSAEGIFSKRRHGISPEKDAGVPHVWTGDIGQAESSFTIPYTKILFGAFIFFVLAITFTFYKFFIGSNTVSGDNIDIVLSGPATIAGGEVLPLDVVVKNNNNVNLQTVDLDIEYPDGTRQPNDPATDMKRYTEILGDINVGKSAERLVKATLFGQENTQQVVKVTVQYKTAGSNAIFTKEKDYDVLISSAPVNITVTAPTEVNANQQTDYLVNVTSNSLTVIKGLLLKVDYPFGFTVNATDPIADTKDDSVFNIGDLAPGAHRTFKITGSIAGQDGEERVLKFTIGTPSATDQKAIGTPYALYTSSVSIKKPFISLDLSLNQDTSDQVAIGAGERINANIAWQNNLPVKVYNMSIKVHFGGLALDQSSVSVNNGFYDSSSNTIVFDKSNISDIATVNPSDQGTMSFDFSSLVPGPASNISFGNAQIAMDVSIYGSRADTGANPELLYSGKKILKISSGLNLLSRGFRTVGPFANTGPFPPKVNTESTYTITWTATDGFNNIDAASVSATLPQNVKWLGVKSPSDQNISYNNVTNQITWNIGNLRSETGSRYPARDVSFQVAVTPSITQVGSEITLINDATITGTDDFSGQKVGAVKTAVTTNITSDPDYIEDIGKVVK